VADEKDYLNLTLGDRLVSVRRAIEKTESVQSYKINGREKENPILTTLYEREEKILKKISQYGEDYIEGAKKSTRTAFKMVGTNVSF